MLARSWYDTIRLNRSEKTANIIPGKKHGRQGRFWRRSKKASHDQGVDATSK
jgi:hypothetical protein